MSLLKKSFILFSILFIITIIGFGVWTARHYLEENLFLSNFFERVEQATVGEEHNIGKEILPSVAVPGVVRVPILVYHLVRPNYFVDSTWIRKYNVEPRVFEKELQYLADNGYVSITLDDLVHNLINGIPLPSKPVILTFDDGWEMQYKNAFPLLKKYHFTATFYIFTNAVGHKHFLTWQEIKTLDNSGMVIGSHTKSHPYLSKITDEKILRDEIIESKKILESHLGHPITAFAPSFGHYNDKIIAIAKEAGYTSLRTGYEGEYHTKDDLFSLKSIPAPDDLNKFIDLLK